MRNKKNYLQGNSACKEHLELASYIKEVHHDLRQDSAKIGFDAAWAKHCSNSDVLQQYASSMTALAMKHWEPNAVNNFADSRIQWVYDRCRDYFKNNGVDRSEENEIRKMSTLLKDSTYVIKLGQHPGSSSQSKIKLLDVGSCYNPFSSFDEFDVLAIDIAPGNQSVKKCDFLNVKCDKQGQIKLNDREIEHLTCESFDAVVFSLLLEYFPSPIARFQCCEKAYHIIKPRGILIIITPDSKHATANAHIMRQWRVSLATLGFWRIDYEKLQHLHCMTFRKCPDPNFPKLWAKRELEKCESFQNFDSPAQMIIIPQDSKIIETSESPCHTFDTVDPQMFEELPNFSSD